MIMMRSQQLRTGRAARLGLSVLLCGMLACRADERRTPDTQFAAGAMGPAADVSYGEGTVFTSNEGGQSLTRIDLSSGTTEVIELAIVPHNVQATRDGRMLLAVGASAMTPGEGHDEHAAGGALVTFAIGSNGSGDKRRFSVGSGPAHVIADSAATRAFITNSGDNSVVVVDLSSGRHMAVIPTGVYPHGLRMSPEGSEIFVACINANAVSIIDTRHLREAEQIEVGRAPVQIAFLPNGERAYVSLRDENAVAVIDVKARRVIDRVAVGSSPIQLFATPDSRFVYVANQGTRERPDSTVSIIDTRTNRVETTVVTGHGAHGVVISRDGSRAFIANTFANTVSVIDTRTRRVLGHIPVGPEPSGITHVPE